MSEPKGSYKAGNKFGGFDRPAQNYSKLPHKFIEQLPVFETMAEMKVVIYLLRHTWGYSEYGKPKRITTDEFMNGRKRKDGKRIDGGTGLANNSVIDGLERAVSHGFVVVEVDNTDKARIEKCYCLNMSGVQTLHIEDEDMEELNTDPQKLHSSYEESAQRSEKETLERNLEKEIDIAAEKQKELIIEALKPCAIGLWAKTPRTWWDLEEKIRSAQTTIENGVLVISGLGMEAALLESRLSRTFNNFLVVNTIGGFTSLTFQE